MSERRKKILILLGFILIASGIAYGLYVLFFRTSPPPIAPGPALGIGEALPATGAASGVRPIVTGPGTLPGSTTSRPQVIVTGDRSRELSARSAEHVSLAPGGSAVRFYDKSSGRFYRLNSDGTSTALSDKAFYNVESVDWGHRTDQAILTYPDGSNIYFDFEKDRQVTLPKHWEDFDFSSDDAQVVAKSVGVSPSNRFLVVSNPDGTNAQAVESLGANDDKVVTSWSPSDQIVAYAYTADEPLGFDTQAIVMVGKNQENFANLIVEGRGFVPSWSPTGKQLLYSVYSSQNDFRPSLWVSGAVGDQINENRRSLGIETWADKCAWSGESSLLCAVPVAMEDGAGLSRGITDTVPDHFYRINLATGSSVNLGPPKRTPTTVSQILVSPDGRKAFYTDKATGRVSEFDL